MSTIPIDPAVALAETQALAEFYRNRTLLLAQAVAELRARLQVAEAGPAGREPPPSDPDTDPDADPDEVTQ